MESPASSGCAACPGGARPARLDTAAAVAVLLVAGAVRIAYLAEWNRNPFSYMPVLDADFFHRLAAGSLSYPGLACNWNPLYPLFLKAAHFVFGPDLRNIYTAQALIGMVNCELVFILAKRTFKSTPAALVSGMLAAFYAPSVFYDGLLLDPTVTAFLVLGFLNLWAASEGRPLLLLPAGLLLGLSTLARPNIAAFIPVAAAWPLLFERNAPARRRILAAAAVALGTAVPLAAMAARNYAAEKDFVLISAHGGVNFYIGNGPGATGVYRPAFPGPHGLEGQIMKARSAAREEEGRPLKSSEVSSHFYRKAYSRVLDDPAGFLGLLGRKSALFFNSYEAPLDYNYHFHESRSRLLGLPMPGFGLLAVLAAAGAALALLDRSGGRIAAFAFVYACTVVAFFVSSRYRMPFAVAIFPFAGYGICGAASALKSVGLTRVIAAFGAAALAAGVAFVPVERSGGAASFRSLGMIYGSMGIFARAEEAYLASLAEEPESSPTMNNLGNLYFERGRPAEAEEWFRKAVDADPENAQARNNLGTCMSKRGDLFSAEEQFLEAIRIDPAYATPYRNLARMYRRQGMADQAREVLEELERIGRRD